MYNVAKWTTICGIRGAYINLYCHRGSYSHRVLRCSDGFQREDRRAETSCSNKLWTKFILNGKTQIWHELFYIRRTVRFSVTDTVCECVSDSKGAATGWKGWRLDKSHSLVPRSLVWRQNVTAAKCKEGSVWSLRRKRGGGGGRGARGEIREEVNSCLEFCGRRMLSAKSW